MTYRVGWEHDTYPYSAVTYIEVTFPDGTEASGSGAVVGRNDVITAAHVIYSDANGGLADSITVYPGRDGTQQPYGSYQGDYANYFEVDLDNDGLFTQEESERDVAVIGFDEPLGLSTGWFGTDANAFSGYYNLTGYPGVYSDFTGPRMTNDFGYASLSSLYDVWEYDSIDSNPGNSGGPLWYEEGGDYYLTGVASTGGWAMDIFAQAQTIQDWIDGNDYLLNENVAPAASDDTASTRSGTPREIAVLANDSDPDGDTLSLTNVSNPGNGSAAITDDGQVRYTPDSSFAGTDSFTYTVADGQGGTDQATVTVTVTAPPDQVTIRADGSGDFNGDGTDDILWQNPATGQVGQFQMTNGSPAWSPVGTAGGSFEFAGTGDFDGDGTDDVLWTNSNTNQFGQYAMSNGNASWDAIGRAGANFEAVGTGDFNGDGTDDILWHNSATGTVGQHQMSNGNGRWDFITTASGNFTFSGTGDFNADGTDDLFWHNTATGQFGQHQMSNGNASWDSFGTAGGSFTFAGTGDFNGDGADDLLWVNPSTGSVGFHDVSSGGPVWNGIGTSGGNYAVAGTGDYTGNGTDEVLWFNSANGRSGLFEITNGRATWQPLGSDSGNFAPLANQVDDGMLI